MPSEVVPVVQARATRVIFEIINGRQWFSYILLKGRLTPWFMFSYAKKNVHDLFYCYTAQCFLKRNNHTYISAAEIVQTRAEDIFEVMHN